MSRRNESHRTGAIVRRDGDTVAFSQGSDAERVSDASAPDEVDGGDVDRLFGHEGEIPGEACDGLAGRDHGACAGSNVTKLGKSLGDIVEQALQKYDTDRPIVRGSLR